MDRPIDELNESARTIAQGELNTIHEYVDYLAAEICGLLHEIEDLKRKLLHGGDLIRYWKGKYRPRIACTVCHGSKYDSNGRACNACNI